MSNVRSLVQTTGFSISVHDELRAEEARLIDSGLGEANEAAAPLHEVQPLSCFLRSSEGAVLGGAVGRTWGKCCELQQLWVLPSYRGRGLGSLLVRRFEERAESRGCSMFYLETFSFQAPALYAALGYESKLALHGFGPGIVKFVMVRESSALSATRETGT
ncbi:MAG: GNAT family N-acetyltransferase [Luteimonas sp.]|nr:GNAT family N-acetyltransferase [Luteimonas sp.]